MKFYKDNLLLYAITDGKREGLLEKIEEALRGGVTMVQMREKNVSEEDLIREAVKVRELCHSYGVPLIINDNVEAALKSGADGVHVGIEDAPVAEIRRIAGDDFIIGATAKTVGQACAAEADGADYLGVGAVFPSPTKKNALRITRTQLYEICSSVKIPAVAIGGINSGNILELKGGGMRGVAVVSALFSDDNIKFSAEQLKALAREAVENR